MLQVVIFLSIVALAYGKPHYTGSQHEHWAQPTAGPVYYKPVNPELFYPSYFQGQFRPVRSEETVAPAAETVAEASAEQPAEEAEARAGKSVEPAPVAYTTADPPPPPVYTTAAPPPPPPAPRSYPAPAYKPVPEPAYAPAAYSFEWLVKDDYSKNDYSEVVSYDG